MNQILFTLFSAFISGLDIKNGSVPRIAFAIAFPSFLIIKILFNEGFSFNNSITGLITGILIFLLAYMTTGKKLGLADVWYSALIGMVLGVRLWYMAISFACLTGIIFMLIKKKRQIPFIPCMAMGSIAMNFIRG